MTEDIIGMEDMMAVYEVTDQFEIDRETISVPLEKEGSGSVQRQPNGGAEIIVPATVPVREWLPTLKGELERAGFQLAETEEEGWDE